MSPHATASATPEVLTEDAPESRLYEIAVLLPYPMGQKEEQQAMKEVENIFREAGTKEVSKDVWGRRGLAYPVEGHKEGNFIIYHHELDPSKLKEMDAALRIIPGVLRHLIVKPPKGYQIVKHSEMFTQWLKTRESTVEIAKREREAEIQKRVAERAKRQVKRTEKAKAEEPAAEAPNKEEISKKLDKLISDDSIEI